MSFPAYQTYKDSGVEWLGAIPDHWHVARLGSLFDEAVDAGSDDLPILSVSIHDGVSDSELPPDEMDRKVTRSDDKSKYKQVRPGDLVYNMMRAWQGGFGTVLVHGMVSPAYVVARPRLRNQQTAFVEHILRTPTAVEEIRRHSQGVTDFRLRLYWDEFKNIRVPLPPPAEQRNILAFLDRETAKIDTLIAEQQHLIDLLKEKRQAVISQAVTKGLDPDARVKDSGVDWLGEVPAHWEVTRVGHRYDVQLGRMLNEERSRGENMRKYLRVFDVQWDAINIEYLPEMDFPPEEQNRYRLRAGDLLVNEGGSYVGRSAIWRGGLEECYYQKALHRLRPYDYSEDTAEFFLYVMEMATNLGVFVAGANQTTIDHLTAEQLKAYRFVFPPLQEQEAIAKALRSSTGAFQALLAEAGVAIALLQERRSALISAAVTGKIDVQALVSAEAEAA